MLDVTTDLYCDGVLYSSIHSDIICSYFASAPFFTHPFDTSITNCCCNGPITFNVEFFV